MVLKAPKENQDNKNVGINKKNGASKKRQVSCVCGDYYAYIPGFFLVKFGWSFCLVCPLNSFRCIRSQRP